MVAPKRDGRAAEVMGQALGVAHHFDHVGVLVILQVMHWVGGGAHARLRGVGQHLGHGVDECGVDQRLIALHIDHHGIAVQAEQGAGLGQAVAAARVVRVGQNSANAVGGTGIGNGGAVSGHHHLGRLTAQRLLGNTHHHGGTANVGQGFVRQARGGQPRRDQNVKAHGARAWSSSSLKVRASPSSKMGMPSRTG